MDGAQQVSRMLVEPFGPPPRPSTKEMMKVMLAKHFFVALRRRRWWGMLFPTVLYGGIVCVGWHGFNQVPTPEVRANGIALLAPAYLLLATTAHLQLATVDIVSEKESKLKIIQAINGLPSRVYWLSWFVYFMVCGAACCVVTLTLTTVFCGLFAHSNLFLVFGILMLNYAQVFAAACCLSILFSRAETAGQVSQFLAMVLFGIAIGMNALLRGAGDYVFYVASLVPVVGIYTSLTTVLWLEAAGHGLTFSSLSVNCCAPGLDSEPTPFFPAGPAMAMLVFDVVAYFLFCWWLDHVWQGEYGTAKPVCFCLRYVIECPHRLRRGSWPRREDQMRVRQEPQAMSLIEFIGDSRGASAGNHGGVAISIQQLTKVFGTQTAIDQLSLDIFMGEIFALLGHNGAGKTTTLNCLVGLIPPTSGTAYVNGYSVLDQIDDVRQQLAICPQDSPMYNEFTVDRHLRFFATLRGVRDPSADVPQVLGALGLSEKRYSVGDTLSGGQKRRLWVATALIGAAPVVFLDEPTSGMDPSARRDLWALLTRRRSTGRSIVFTTHYLEEADILANRKAVLARGQVQAVGTSRELKLNFGVGYHLEVELGGGPQAGGAGAPQAEEVRSIVRQQIPRSTEPPSEAAARRGAAADAAVMLNFKLPYSEIDSFGPLLLALEQRRAELGISDYGLQMTSLEEVFMRLGSQADESAAADGAGNAAAAAAHQGDVEMVATNGAEEALVREPATVFRGVCSVMSVRYRCLSGNRRRMVHQLVLPSLLLALSMGTRSPGGAVANQYVAMYVPMGFSILVIYFTVALMMDKANKCKFVALSQGLPAKAYWGGSFLFDYLVTLPIVVEVPLLVVAFNEPTLNGPGLPLIVAECVIYPLALLAFAYYATNIFTTVESMVKYMPMANLLFGTLPPLAIYNLAVAGGVYDRWAEVAHISMSLLNPFYGLPGILIYVIRAEILRSADPDADVPHTPADYFVYSTAAPLYLSMVTAAVLAWRLIRQDQSSNAHGYVAPLGGGAAAEAAADGSMPIGDDDVLAEESRLRSETRTDAGGAVVYKDLRHTYPAKARGSEPVHAVRGISLGISRGECFGLLGPNGAGKTTTLAILTGELWPPTSGQVLIGGHDVAVEGFGVLHRQLGNCPQVDPLWPDLPVRDHLVFYGRVKGVPEADLHREVEALLQRLGFGDADARKRAKECSGGMKRKLAVGIALIGRSELLLLDEPSAAVDAAAKRHLWHIIRSRGARQTALLTTHSMEEAEALCDRLTIQISGQLRCLGSPIHLRHKYGKGYQLELFAAHRGGGGGQAPGSQPPEEAAEEAPEGDALAAFVHEHIAANAALLEAHPGRYLFQLPPMDGSRGSADLSTVFLQVSRSRQELGITEYSLWRPSLEQVFLRFAREQQDASGPGAGSTATATPSSIFT